MEKVISRGAEAVLIKKKDRILKRRVPKGYRHPELDKKIRSGRTRREAKLIAKAREVINAPEIFCSDDKKAEIEMEFINGKKLSDYLDKFPLNEEIKICQKIGEETALLHNKDLIHGDLTTSNLIKKGKEVYFIDFGLGFHSQRAEDKAVDLHLLRQALESKHFKNWEKLFDAVLKGYSKKGDKKVISQLKKVESRGRYKGKH